MNSTVSIIVPCYNEEAGLPQLKKRIQPVIATLQNHYDVELVLVDDGSTDNTNTLLRNFFGHIPYVKIVTHARNKNLGGALRTGIAHCTGDVVAMLDSDCTYDPSVVIDLLKALDADTDIVTASPLHPQGKVIGVPDYRIFLSKTVSRMYKTLLNSKLHTHTAMVRVYRRKVLDTVAFQSNDFLSVTELLAKAILQKYTVKELPYTITVRQYGTSKMRFISVIKSHAQFLSKIVLHKTLGAKI